MDEKFYIVSEESPLYQEYLDYKASLVKVNDLAKDFMKSSGIETTEYCPENTVFYICPTENDKVKFSKQLSKYGYPNGLFSFKRSSAVNKTWISLLKITGIEVLHQPRVSFFFKGCFCKSRSRIFELNGKVYVEFDVNGDIDTPAGFHEILGSEFWKAIEEWEVQNNG